MLELVNIKKNIMNTKIENFTQDEFINNKEVYNICKDIYDNKYFFEEFSLDGYSGLTFLIFKLDDDIIGFSSYQDCDYMNVVDTTFKIEYRYSEYQITLLKEIISSITNNSSIYVWQSIEDDYNFYLNNGFKLYKDYGEEISVPGYDTMRYSLEYVK